MARYQGRNERGHFAPARGGEAIVIVEGSRLTGMRVGILGIAHNAPGKLHVLQSGGTLRGSFFPHELGPVDPQ
jgi:hypothetical protein